MLVRFRRSLGEEGVGHLLASTINVAVTLKLIAKRQLAPVIVDSTVLPKAMEPVIGQLKEDHSKRQCHLRGEGDRWHAVLCAAGYNIHWRLRIIATRGLNLFLRMIE